MVYAVLISHSIEGVAQFLTVLLIFFIVLALTYFTTRFVGKYQKLQNNYRNFEAIETYRVTGNKYLQLVRVGKRYFIIAIGKDEISFLAEMSEDDIDLNMETPAQNDRFRQVLELAREKITKRGDKQ